MTDSTEQDEALWGEMNSQTGRIGWTELERHFARGVIIRVASGLDLVDVALQVVRNNTTQLEQWMADGSVIRATDDDAREWGQSSPQLWAVVASPWVLVQETRVNKDVE